MTEGRVLDERYALDDVIGRGGTADVYRATDKVLGRAVAVKVLRAHAERPNHARFVDEARMLAGLDHPNLVTVLDVGMAADQPFLVMTLVEGTTLSRRERVPMPLDQVAALGAQVAGALSYAHLQGIVHRDVKPGNVLVDEEGRARLADFGISRIMGDAVRHTETGQTIGTAAYLAPEQVRGGEIGPAADVYSLGLVLLELVTGRLEYPGAPLEAAMARLSRQPELPTALPPPWQRLLRKMTALEPGERWTAARCAEELDELADPELAATMPGMPPIDEADQHTQVMEALNRRRRAPRRWWYAGAGAAATLAVLVSAMLLSGSDESPGDVDPVPMPTAGVPDDLGDPLQDLHDAVNGTDR